MKTVKCIGHQGDVAIFEIDDFPEGERYQDDLTKKGQLALGELSGHNHAFEDTTAVNLFKVKDPRFQGLTFIETKKPAKLVHGLIKGWKGKEADQDYHSEVTFTEGKKFATGIVEETDWMTRSIRKVID